MLIKTVAAESSTDRTEKIVLQGEGEKMWWLVGGCCCCCWLAAAIAVDVRGAGTEFTNISTIFLSFFYLFSKLLLNCF
jgi:hypothetical protein